MDRDGVDLAGTRQDAQSAPGGASFARLPRPVRAVVLDLDGTLLDTEGAYRAAFTLALGDVGRSMPPSDYEQLVGLPSTARRELLPRMMGAAFPVDAFLSAYYRRRDSLLAGVISLKPGGAELLGRLDRWGLPCAVATSASTPTAMSNLRLAGLSERFPVLVTRDDVPRGKPAPDSFLLAATRLGFAPRDCLAVEDSPSGVAAAYSAGLMVVMVPDALAATPETARCCVATLDSLRDVALLLAPDQTDAGLQNDRSRLRA